MTTEAFHMTETSPELAEALSYTLGDVFGQSRLSNIGAWHTGGGVMVLNIDLTIDARGLGRQLWLTRDDEHVWLLGFYDFAEDPEDEGICVSIHGFRHTDGTYSSSTDSPAWLASQVAGILTRLGVTKLQGE